MGSGASSHRKVAHPQMTETAQVAGHARMTTRSSMASNTEAYHPDSNGDSPTDSWRRGSFSFLRRSKSRERGAAVDGQAKRSFSGAGRGGSKLGRKTRSTSKEEATRQEQEEHLQMHLQHPKQVPRLPSYKTLPNLNTPFENGPTTQVNHNSQPKSYAVTSGRPGYNPGAFYQRQQRPMDRSVSASHHDFPVPPIHESPTSHSVGVNGPSAKTESMTNRGRYSYTTTAINHVNSPRRIRRRKDPTPFNVLVVGTKNCGKTAFVEFLRTALSRPVKQPMTSPSPPPNLTRQEANSPFTSHYLETELENERIGLTIYDSKGLERHLVDLQLREMAQFVEHKFEETFREEQKVLRATGVRDTHIHCVFLVLDPSRLDASIALSSPNNTNVVNGKYRTKRRIIGSLDEDLDIDVLRTFQGKATVIPIISKADTITTAHMAYLKRAVWDSFKKVKIDPLEILNAEPDSESEYDDPLSIRALANHDKGHDAISSFYDDANDGEAVDDAFTRHGTAATTSSKVETYPTANSNNSRPPQHAETRYSQLSDNGELPPLPLSIISPDGYEPGAMGRRFPWGFADPYNGEHCDFIRIKDSVFSEWRNDLREAAREKWYEGWRTSRLNGRRQASGSTGGQVSMTNGNHLAPPGRAVSSSAVYGASYGGAPVMKSLTNGVAVAPRALSTSEIGIAIGTETGASSRVPPAHSRIANGPGAF